MRNIIVGTVIVVLEAKVLGTEAGAEIKVRVGVVCGGGGEEDG